jgi:hypothetical protein
LKSTPTWCAISILVAFGREPRRSLAAIYTSHPIIDKVWQDRPLIPQKNPINDYLKVVVETIDPYGNQGDPASAGIAPFGLATAQRAPAQVLAAFQQAAHQGVVRKVTADGSGNIQDYTGVTHDAHIIMNRHCRSE